MNVYIRDVRVIIRLSAFALPLVLSLVSAFCGFMLHFMHPELFGGAAAYIGASLGFNFALLNLLHEMGHIVVAAYAGGEVAAFEMDGKGARVAVAKRNIDFTIRQRMHIAIAGIIVDLIVVTLLLIAASILFTVSHIDYASGAAILAFIRIVTIIENWVHPNLDGGAYRNARQALRHATR